MTNAELYRVKRSIYNIASKKYGSDGADEIATDYLDRVTKDNYKMLFTNICLLYFVGHKPYLSLMKSLDWDNALTMMKSLEPDITDY